MQIHHLSRLLMKEKFLRIQIGSERGHWLGIGEQLIFEGELKGVELRFMEFLGFFKVLSLLTKLFDKALLSLEHGF